MVIMGKQRKKKESNSDYTPIPHTRPHSDRVRENDKEARRRARKESKEDRWN